jgi:hypothetical protein
MKATHGDQDVIILAIKPIHDMLTGQITGKKARIRFPDGTEEWCPLHLLTNVEYPRQGISRYWTVADD